MFTNRLKKCQRLLLTFDNVCWFFHNKRVGLLKLIFYYYYWTFDMTVVVKGKVQKNESYDSHDAVTWLESLLVVFPSPKEIYLVAKSRCAAVLCHQWNIITPSTHTHTWEAVFFRPAQSQDGCGVVWYLGSCPATQRDFISAQRCILPFGTVVTYNDYCNEYNQY